MKRSLVNLYNLTTSSTSLNLPRSIINQASLNKSVHEPISLEEASQWLNVLKDPSTKVENLSQVAVGVSGGGDSTLLSYLLSQLLPPSQGKLNGVVVNHNLRPESTAEAELTVNRLQSMNVKPTLIDLVWGIQDPSVTTGFYEFRKDKLVYYCNVDLPTDTKLETVARLKRYEALSVVMRNYDQSTLALGHHLNDSIETALFRISRESGIVGLSGILPLRKFPLDEDQLPKFPSRNENLHLFRPMLAVPKQRIYNSLKFYGLEWVEDPTNHLSNSRHQRTVIRNLLAKTNQSDDKDLVGLKDQALIGFVDRMDNHRLNIESRVNNILKDYVHVKPEFGIAQLHVPTTRLPNFWLDDKFLSLRVITKLSQFISNNHHPALLKPASQIYRSLLGAPSNPKADDNIPNLRRTNQFGLQMGGAMFISPTKSNPWWTVTRDPFSVLLQRKWTLGLNLDVGMEPVHLIWDKRYRIKIKILKNWRTNYNLLKLIGCFLPGLHTIPQGDQYAKLVLRPISQTLLNQFRNQTNLHINQFSPKMQQLLDDSNKLLRSMMKVIPVENARHTIPLLCVRVYSEKLKEMSDGITEINKEFVDVPIAFPTFRNLNLISSCIDVRAFFLPGSLV